MSHSWPGWAWYAVGILAGVGKLKLGVAVAVYLGLRMLPRIRRFYRRTLHG